MAQYLLSVYQPVGPAPAPEFLEPIMRDLEALNREMKAAGAWVFAAGLHPTDTATVVRQQGAEAAHHRRSFRRRRRSTSAGSPSSRRPDLDAALGWAGKLARATTLPIEVRPIQH